MFATTYIQVSISYLFTIIFEHFLYELYEASIIILRLQLSVTYERVVIGSNSTGAK